MTTCQPGARPRRADPEAGQERIVTGHRQRFAPLRLARITKMQGGNLKCEI
jgi:hypothetical protein